MPRGMSACNGEVVKAVFEGLASGGASRHVVAAAVAAMVRTLMQADGGIDEDNVREVKGRLRLVEPALRQLVAGRAPSGAQRALRNVALHGDLGQGADSLPTSAMEAKRRQRGGKRQQEKLIENVCGQLDTPEVYEAKQMDGQPVGPVKVKCHEADTATKSVQPTCGGGWAG